MNHLYYEKHAKSKEKEIMRQSIMIVLVVFALLPMPAVQAQADQGGTMPCTEDELAAASEALQTYDEAFGALMDEYDLSTDPTETGYGATIVALDAFDTDYWNTVYPALPACYEAQALGFLFGTMYDEYLTIALLQNMAAWSEAAEIEGATIFSENVAARLEKMDAAMQAIVDVPLADVAAALTGENLQTCTEEEQTTAYNYLVAVMTDLNTLLAAVSENPVSTFALTETESYTFDNEIFPQMTTCIENQGLAWILSMLLSDFNITTGLMANAAVEAAVGNTQVAEAMSASAEVRITDLQAAFTHLITMMQ
jgi:hypothetical protein